jgi:AraC family transcriptional regulator of adaptative response/methylated-DNA-[protein]-cysteine methyltransferase
MTTTSSSPEWAAVLARDRRLDGRFVYAVRSTRIYCRPSCPARRPQPANVCFFATPDAAERAGYRACRRCLPRSAAGAMIDICVGAARAYLDAHLDEWATLAELAAHVGVSPFHLQRVFKAQVGLSPRAYLSARRIERFKAGVRAGASVSDALYQAGFSSPRALYEQADAALGMTPAAYRRGGAGLAIAFTVVRSPLGRLLVARTDRGVCAVSLGDSAAALERELRAEFPAARTRRDDAALRREVEALLAQLDDPRRPASLPLDVRGTDFQRRVWAALQAIPPGETRSYRQLAAAIGRPSAARAVARACATNPVAVVIPCHRVVRGDGTLSGYRWGRSRKEALLMRERSPAK